MIEVPRSEQVDVSIDLRSEMYLSTGLMMGSERTQLSTNTLLRSLEGGSLSLSRQIFRGLKQVIDMESLPIRLLCGPYTESTLSAQTSDIRLVYMVLFALANNHVRLERLRTPEQPMDEVIRTTLQRFNDLAPDRFSRFLDSFPVDFRRGLERSLFCAAVKLGAHRMLESILNRGVDHRSVVMVIADRHVVPLIRACELAHVEITRSLLARGGDLKSWSQLLLHACLPISPNPTTVPLERVAIFRLLLQAGIIFQKDDINFLHSFHGSLLYQACAEHIRGANYTMFIESRFLIDLCHSQDEEIIHSTLEMVLSKEWSPETRASKSFISRLSDCLEIAALKNYQQALGMLLAAGAIPTSACLRCAILEKNIPAITYFLDCGVSCFSTTHSDWAPIAEAILSDSANIQTIFWKRNLFGQLVQYPEAIADAVGAACEAGNESMLDYLLQLWKSSTILVGRNSHPRNASRAIHKGHGNLLKKVLQAGLDFSSYSTFASALRKPDIDLVRLLIEANPAGTLTHDNLHLVAHSGCTEILRDLILADVPLIGWFKRRHGDLLWGDSFENFGQYPIMTTAVLSGHRKVIDLLFESGVPLNCGEYSFRRFNDNVMSPLWAAVWKKEYSLIQELLARGADPFDELAISEASSASDHRAATLILEATDNWPQRSKRGFVAKALCDAIRGEDLDMLSLLLRYANPYEVGSRSSANMATPFGDAIASTSIASLRMMKMFLDHGAAVNGIVLASEFSRNDALLQAIATRRIAKVEMLIEAGAMIGLNAKKGVQYTPLQAAVDSGALDIIQYLLQKGADPNEPPTIRNGASSLQLAAKHGYIGIASLLVDNGADVNSPPALFFGRTAFEMAAGNGRIEMMLFLVDKGVDLVSDGGKQYKRATEFARTQGHVAAVELAERLYAEACGEMVSSMTPLLGDGLQI